MPGRRRPARGAGSAGPELTVRRATRADVELLVAHRRKMWLAIGGRLRAHLDRADAPYRRWLRREFAGRTFLGFVVEGRDGRVAGSGGLWLAPSQPRPGRLARRRMPYVMSMFTEPEFRGRGVASAIVRAQIDWAARRGYARIYLHASEMGRPVYARLGFVPGNEMRLELPDRRPRPRRRVGARAAH